MTYPFTQPILSKLLREITDSIREAGIDPDAPAVQKMTGIMYRTLVFNRSLIWRGNSHVFLPKEPRELLAVYRLRRTVYDEMGYGDELPDEVPGYDFDRYDECSAVLFTKNTDTVTSTCRVIFDSTIGMPIEKMYPFGAMRQQGKNIAELSRLARLRSDRGLSQEFKYLVQGAYYTMVDNGMDVLVSAMIPEHYRYYKNFGGFEVIEELDGYGGLDIPFVITAWDVSAISRYFKRIFLGLRENKTAAQ